ncbi:Short-chain dehydrogenase/reductase SDR protein [Dioscorea alata]|uniref:Short-chain dehydrogenase/reductase SDR protein n=1 Tax=Dioscorea alata TaxID=55571 RepID=A0ACB7TUL8_DIOAL|nr:Short-chain dehydrogenase/reductase SDR protein [Dioscorea alata]
MAAIAKLQISVQSFYHPSSIDFSSIPNRNSSPLAYSGRNPRRRDGVSLYRWWKDRHFLAPMRCRSFRSEEEKTGRAPLKRKGPLYSLKSLILKVSGLPSQSGGGEYRKAAVEKAEEIFFSVVTQLGRYLLTMMSTGVILAVGFQLSGGDNQMNTLIWYSWLGGIIIGTMIGANTVLEEHCNAGPRNVVITGSTRGLGKALAREFLLSGDRVVIASRSPESVCTTVEELNENLKEGISMAGDKGKGKFSRAKVVGMACDVCKPDSVRKLADFAVDELGSIDIWINNAGTNKGFRPLIQFTDDDITQIVSTNLIGSLICTKEALRVMKSQDKGGHIFNMDGAGSGGSSTPLTAVYGSTKCGLRQLHASLQKENKRSKTGIHTASPGMVLTDLLLSGSTLRNKQMFNIICELPETVARTLVPRMRVVKGNGKAINYLTPPRILLALVTAWLRRGRWFDDQGRALYAAEADRIRNWAESRAHFSFTDAMEMYAENTWVSVFSLSVVCAFIILSSSSGAFPGT